MRAVLALAGLLSLAAAAPSSAATFTVNPTQIFLSGRTTTALLTLKNDSEESLRFQLTAFTWQQAPSGELELTPTRDVVFFPALLTLGPKEERRIRVGSSVTAGAQERTYRIFVEELPPPDGSAPGSAVRVLTKMGIPIFIRPATETASANLRDLNVRNGALRFTVANSGTVHFVPQKIVVRGVSGSGDRVFERDVQGWYILAGGRREFEVEMPSAECGRVATLLVDVEFGSTSVKETLQTPAGACGK
jgi:fimbrial chaperone protein